METQPEATKRIRLKDLSNGSIRWLFIYIYKRNNDDFIALKSCKEDWQFTESLSGGKAQKRSLLKDVGVALQLDPEVFKIHEVIDKLLRDS